MISKLSKIKTNNSNNYTKKLMRKIKSMKEKSSNLKMGNSKFKKKKK